MDDLIVYDEEYEKYIEALGKFGEVVEKQIDSYTTSLNATCQYVITEGQIAENLKLFALCAEGMQGLTVERIEAMRASLTSFVEEIDTADEYIY